MAWLHFGTPLTVVHHDACFHGRAKVVKLVRTERAFNITLIGGKRVAVLPHDEGILWARGWGAEVEAALLAAYALRPVTLQWPDDIRGLRFLPVDASNGDDPSLAP